MPTYEEVVALATSHCPMQDTAGSSTIVDEKLADITWSGTSFSTAAGPTSSLPSSIVFNGSNNYARQTAWPSGASYNRDGTVSCWVYPTNWGSFGRHAISTRAGNYGFILGSWNGNFYLNLRHASGSTTCDPTWNPALNEWSHVCWTWLDGSANLYVNGVLDSESPFTYNTGAVDYLAGFYLTYGAQPDNGYPWHGRLADAIFFDNVALTSAQVSALYAGPTTSTSYSLTAEVGGLSVTGKDASALKVGRILIAGSMDLDASGQDAALKVGKLLSASGGALSLSAVDASLAVGRELSADTGAFTVTGYDANLPVSYKLAADTGAFTVTGYDASLAVGRELTADTGAFTVDGKDASLSASFRMSAEEGAFTAQAVDLTKLGTSKKLEAGTGAFTDTGYDALLTIGRKLLAESGAFLFTGYDAGFDSTNSFTLSAESGAFSATGIAAAISTSRLLPADAGAFLATGIDASLSKSCTLLGSAAAFLATGYDAGLSRGYTIHVDSTPFKARGWKAGLKVGRKLQAGIGAFLLTGSDAEWRRKFLLPASQGNFILRGVDVTLYYSNEELPIIETEASFLIDREISAYLTDSLLVAERVLDREIPEYLIVRQSAAATIDRSMPELEVFKKTPVFIVPLE